MKNKSLSLLLAGLLCISSLSACTNLTETKNETESDTEETIVEEKADTAVKKEGFPLSDEKLDFDIYALKWPQHSDYKDMECFKTYEDMTNIHINWTMMPHESANEKKNLLFANKDGLPDAFWGQIFTNDEILNFASQNLVIPLNDLIDEYGPNIKAAMEKCPALAKAMTAPDGNIYSLAGCTDPSVTHMPVSQKMWINQVWLDALNEEIPTSIDELYDILVKMKNTDLNGNGKADEIPFTIEPDNIVPFMTPWGISGPTIVEDGVVKSGYLQEGFRDGLRWFNKLYEEGLMDVEVFTQTYAQFSSKSAGDELKYGFFPRLADFQIVGLKNEPYYEPVPALEGPAGRNIVVDESKPIVANKFTITSNCEDPAALIRWVDYFYTDLGSLSVVRGPEGVGYEKNDDGSYQVLVIPDDIAGSIPGGTSPFYASTNIHPNASDVALLKINEECYYPYRMEEYFPSNIFSTLEENEIRQEYTATINTFTQEAIARFITGDLDIDSDKDYNNFIEELKSIGIEEMVKTDQAAYDRYMSIQ